MIQLPVVVISTALLSSASYGFESSHMKQFQIMQCYQGQCFRAEGDLAFLSMNQDSMAARDVKLEIQSGPNSLAHQQTCAQFRFHFHSQSLTCDNREVSGIPTLLIDSQFKISKILSNRKNKS